MTTIAKEETAYLQATSLFSDEAQIADVLMPELKKYRSAIRKRDYKLLGDATQRVEKIFVTSLAYHASKIIEQLVSEGRKLPMSMKVLAKRISVSADTWMRHTLRSSTQDEIGFIDDIIAFLRNPRTLFLKELRAAL